MSRQARNPLTMDVAPDGRVLRRAHGARSGRGARRPAARRSRRSSTVSLYGENGLLGIGLDPDFTRTPWVYLFYALLDDFQPPPDYDADALPL